MSAPTPAPGDESPREGYYPDPSIPGYVRYWNGASWVPGTSRPAPPQDGTAPAALPAPAADPAPGRPAPVDETGPVYLDADGEDADGADAAPGRGRPASAWQADTSRQTGFGGERDHRVAWGGPDPRVPGAGAPGPGAGAPPSASVPRPAASPADGAPADPRRPGVPEPARGALPGMRDGNDEVTEGTVTLRAEGPGSRPPTDGTVTIRPVGPAAGRPPLPRQEGPAHPDGARGVRALPPGGAPQPAPAPAPASTPPQAQAPAPGTPPPPGAAGAAPWPQQVHQLAQPAPTARPQQPLTARQGPLPAQQQGVVPGQQGPVVPWKPPVDDPFQQLARSQAAARPAALGKRLAARLVDTAVLGALVGAAGFPLVTRALDHVDQKIQAAKLSGETVTVWLLDSTTAALFGGVLAVFLVLGALLEAVPTARWGRTLGKKLCGLEVRDIESHDAPDLGAALRRWLVYGVLGLVVVGVVNVLWCLIDRPWRQCWHDKAARTFVAGG
ncbi:RDD family protein [Streptomyces sp. NPDC058008]|uniref:RDD family protein n=1 Tax=Streptomyces sp. NPDC058008 TaxID=3346303 RepID=UPI0036EBE114